MRRGEKFFTPLGMTTTNTSVTLRKPNENWASPHVVKHGEENNTAVRYDVIDNCGGAAVINSNVAELAQWMRLQLGRGTYNGKKFFSAAQSHQMWQPNIFIPISPAAEKFNPSRHFYGYGMGWFLADYQGRKVVSHGGGMTGMISQTALMPEENLGVVILTNSETSLPSWMVNKVFDVFLGVPNRNWSAEYLDRTNKAKTAAKADEAKTEAAQVKNTKPSLELAKYAGTYTSPLYGEAKITEENGKLVLQLMPAPNFIGDLEHWHYDTFTGGKAKDGVFENMKYTFQTDAGGFIAAVSAPFEASVSPIVFKKKPDSQLFDPAYLARFAGEYSLMGTPWVVSLKGNALVVNSPGQSQMDLIPNLSGDFAIKQTQVVTLHFVNDESGKPNAIEIRQPGTVLTAKRK